MVGVCFGRRCPSASYRKRPRRSGVDAIPLWHKMQSRRFFRYHQPLHAPSMNSCTAMKRVIGQRKTFFWYTGICKKLRLSGKEGGSLCFQSGNILFMALTPGRGSREAEVAGLDKNRVLPSALRIVMRPVLTREELASSAPARPPLGDVPPDSRAAGRRHFIRARLPLLRL